MKKKEEKSHNQNICKQWYPQLIKRMKKIWQNKMTALCVLYNTMILSIMKVAALEWNFVVL